MNINSEEVFSFIEQTHSSIQWSPINKEWGIITKFGIYTDKSLERAIKKAVNMFNFHMKADGLLSAWSI